MLVPLHATEPNPSVAVSDKPGDGALHHGAPLSIGNLKPLGACLATRFGKQVMVRVHFQRAPSRARGAPMTLWTLLTLGAKGRGALWRYGDGDAVRARRGPSLGFDGEVVESES